VYENLLIENPYNVNPWTLRSDYLPALFRRDDARRVHQRIGVARDQKGDEARDVEGTIPERSGWTQRMYKQLPRFTGDSTGCPPTHVMRLPAPADWAVGGWHRQAHPGANLNDRLPLDLAVVTSTNTQK